MAKRRLRASGETSVEELTPEERRARRREERRRAPGGKRPKGPATGWRRAVAPGVAAAAIVAVGLLLFYGPGVLFQPPCLQFQPIPAQSGTPLFPAANTTGSGFATSWCPGDAPVYTTYPRLTILVGGGTVPLPDSIGVSSNFSSYTCTLPLHTQVPGALPSGTISIESAWPYDYTLGQFFQVWQDSYVSAFVNSSYSTHTIDYTSNDLLGLPVDATHTLTLFVDNQPSTQGPGLILNKLSGVGSTYPSCLGKIYGTGHTIVLDYHATSAAAVLGGAPSHVGSTSTPPLTGDALDGSPMPQVPLTPGVAMGLEFASVSSLTWLVLRPA